jgi:hypothetical protein
MLDLVCASAVLKRRTMGIVTLIQAGSLLDNACKREGTS